MNRRIASQDGRITWGNGLVAATEAVHAKLVCKPWRHVMRGAGLAVEPLALRPALRDLLTGVELDPRPPTLDEIKVALGTKGKHPEEVWALLTRSGSGRGGSCASASELHHAVASHDPEASQPVAGLSTTQAAAASSVPASTQAWPGAPSARRLPIGRRLWTPQPRDLMLLHSSARRHGPSAGTRSQHRPTMPGVVETESQTRSRKRALSLSSIL